MTDSYPESVAARDAWILARRPGRNPVVADRPYGAFVEREPDAIGLMQDVLTLFLTNRECPIRCLVCDLWKNTLPDSVPPGAIPRQIADGLAAFPKTQVIKLYNAGSFFDPAAIPPGDLPAVAELVGNHDRVIVESHPVFLGDSAPRFAAAIGGRLEIAIGLETANPRWFDRLNKRITLAAIEAAFERLSDDGIDIRAFILVGLPWCSAEESVEWAIRSARWAFERGAGAISLIPTRFGNGALEGLAAVGEFSPPTLADLERAVAGALAGGGGRVFADTWEAARFAPCASCATARIERLVAQNLAQRPQPKVACPHCAGSCGE